jgi:hypothetical protein
VSIDSDLDLIENAIKQLQTDWDRFFAGLEKRPPNDLKTRTETLIRRHAGTEIRPNATRFRYQSLSARYASYSELWSKRLRYREEGRSPTGRFRAKHVAAAIAGSGPPAASAAGPAPAPTPAPAAARAAAAPAGIRIRDVSSEGGAVRQLFERFVAARRASGEATGVKFESFERLIAEQTRRLTGERRADAVEFRLETKDGKVSLKARPLT